MKKIFFVLFFSLFFVVNVQAGGYLGGWKINDTLTITANTHLVSTGAQQDATSGPSYRIYEDTTDTAILSGSMTKLDDAGTTGYYKIQITLSAGSGFEKGKTYSARLQATVGSITGADTYMFQIEPEVDANAVSDKTGYSLATSSITSGTYDKTSAYAVPSPTLNDYKANVSGLSTYNSLSDTVIVSSGSKSGYSLSANQSGVTVGTCTNVTNNVTFDNTYIGTVSRLGTQAKADVNAEADTALADYDPPTKTEMDIGHALINNNIGTAQNDLDILTGTDGVTLATAQANYAPAKAGDQMNLTNSALTSAKYDKSSSFPIANRDNGSTQIARVGADGDTLETLSDQIDLTATATNLAITDNRLQSAIGSGFVESTDSLEAIRNRGDVAWTTGSGGSCDLTATNSLITSARSDIAALNDLSTSQVYSQCYSAISGRNVLTTSNVNVSAGVVESNIKQINGNTRPIEMLELANDVVYSGRVVAGTLTTTQFTSNVTNFSIDGISPRRVIAWDRSSSLAGQTTYVLNYSQATGLFTVQVMDFAPSVGDKFVLLPEN